MESIFEKVGTNIPEHIQTSGISTIMKETSLDWNVVQKPIYYEDEFKSQYSKLPQYVGNFREDTNQLLGIVSPKNYKVIQNTEAFEFVDSLQNFNIVKVGMFNRGKQIFVLGKSKKDTIYIDSNQDSIEPYFTFVHGHNGKLGVKMIITPIRLVCMNQMNMLLENSFFSYSIKHTGDVTRKLQQVKEAFNQSEVYLNNLDNEIQSMLNTSFDTSIVAFVDQLIPINEIDTKRIIASKEEMKEQLVNLYNNKDDLQNYKRTNFGVYSAVSDFVSHISPKRKTECSVDNMFMKNIEGNELLIKTQQLLLAA